MKTIRILAMVEADSITGTAKAVLEFAKQAVTDLPESPKLELTIVTFDRGQGETYLTKTIKDLGIPHEIVFERRRFDAKVVSQLQTVVARHRTDVIWSNSIKSHFLVKYAGLHRICRWVAFHHGYTSTDLKMLIYNQFDRWSLRSADRVLTSSGAFVAELEGRGVHTDRIQVQHMPARPFTPASEERKAELRKQLGCGNRTRIVLCVGRLSREKGHTSMIRAFPKIRELAAGLDVHLVLVGEGPERQRIEELICRLQLTDAVTLAGQQNDVDLYYSVADVFVLPSHSEGCPNVLLEAMASGAPIVTTAVGDVPDVAINGVDAILVKENDSEALATATAGVLNDWELSERLASHARGIVSRKSAEVYFQSLASVFVQLCDRDALESRPKSVSPAVETR